MINVTINGEEHQFGESLNLTKLLHTLNLPATRIAVEVNQQVVRRDAWESTLIKNNDKIEIVHFVGGGSVDFGF